MRFDKLIAQQSEAAILFNLGEPLRLVTLSLPPLRSGQVHVAVAYSGVCHTQLLEVQGKRGPDRFLPHALGHEGSGIVVKIGEGVKKVKPGDHVVISWIKGRGMDVPSCVYESTDGCINSGAVSTFMQQTITCENRLTPISHKIPLRIAALLGCAVLTGGGIVRNSAKIQKGSSVAIFGMGGIGLSVLLAAKATEPSMLIAVDIVREKLKMAEKLGATHTICATEVDPVAAISKLTERKGIDFAIEAAGQRETMEQAFRIVRVQGGLCVLAGNLPHGEVISLDPFELIKGKRLIGTWGGDSDPDVNIPEYVKMYLSGKLDLDVLITHEYSLKNINGALKDLNDVRMGRGLIRMQDDMNSFDEQ